MHFDESVWWANQLKFENGEERGRGRRISCWKDGAESSVSSIAQYYSYNQRGEMVRISNHKLFRSDPIPHCWICHSTPKIHAANLIYIQKWASFCFSTIVSLSSIILLPDLPFMACLLWQDQIPLVLFQSHIITQCIQLINIISLKTKARANSIAILN